MMNAFNMNAADQSALANRGDIRVMVVERIRHEEQTIDSAQEAAQRAIEELDSFCRSKAAATQEKSHDLIVAAAPVGGTAARHSPGAGMPPEIKEYDPVNGVQKLDF